MRKCRLQAFPHYPTLFSKDIFIRVVDHWIFCEGVNYWALTFFAFVISDLHGFSDHNSAR